jgi:hypothetical protein
MVLPQLQLAAAACSSGDSDFHCGSRAIARRVRPILRTMKHLIESTLLEPLEARFQRGSSFIEPRFLFS